MSGRKKFKRVALDSNLFIYQFENNPKFIKYTIPVFEKLIENKLQAVTSIISVIEALSYPSPKGVLDKIKEAFITIPNLEIFDVNYDIGVQAAKIRRTNKFRLPDSIQLATALYSKSQAFITNDRRLKKFKELPIVLLREVII